MRLALNLIESDKMEAVLEVTMSLRNWRDLYHQLGELAVREGQGPPWPAAEFYTGIGDLLRQVGETFWPERKVEADSPASIVGGGSKSEL
jgi:hypothetical protein